MKSAYGLSLPTSAAEFTTAARTALIVYDMQVGIVPQIANGEQIVAGCKRLLAAARQSGVRTFFTRHVSLPNLVAGVGQLRRAMIWEQVSDPLLTRPHFTVGSPAYQVVADLAPTENEVVVDKITMSAFEGTYLNIAMRDAQLQAFVIAGIALEVGIEPTVRHALDLNLVPILIPELCGSKSSDAHARTLASLRETGEVPEASEAEVVRWLAGQARKPGNGEHG